jgi:hypothetical protein
MGTMTSHRYELAIEDIWKVLKKAKDNKYGRQRFGKAINDIERILVLTESRIQDDLEEQYKSTLIPKEGYRNFHHV